MKKLSTLLFVLVITFYSFSQLKIKMNFDEFELIRFEKEVSEGKSGGTSYFTFKINELKKLHKIR